MSYELRVFWPQVSVKACLDVFRKFGEVEMRGDGESEWVLLEPAIFGELRPFPQPNSDAIDPCLFVHFSRVSPTAEWIAYMIPLVCLVEWPDAIVVEPYSDHCFTEPDSYVAHVEVALPRRARPR